MKTILIEVDYRERNSGVIEALQKRDDVAVKQTGLDNGDYKINNCWLVERKTLPDLTSSIIDGRLFQQLARYSPGYRKVLLVEGTSKTLGQSNIRREAIQGALIKITLYFGIPVLRSMHPDETASLLTTIGRQMSSFMGVVDSTGINLHPARSKRPYRQKLILL